MCRGFPTSHRHLSHGNMLLILGMVGRAVIQYQILQKGANSDRDIRTSNQSHSKYYVRVYHYIICVNIVLIPKPCLSPWLEHLNPVLINPPCCRIHGAQQRCLLIDTLSEVCYEGAGNVETPPNNKSHPFTFMILRSYLPQKHFGWGCFHWVFLLFWNHICHAFGWLWWPNTCHNVNLSNFTSCDGKDLDQHDWPLPLIVHWAISGLYLLENHSWS